MKLDHTLVYCRLALMPRGLRYSIMARSRGGVSAESLPYAHPSPKLFIPLHLYLETSFSRHIKHRQADPI